MYGCATPTVVVTRQGDAKMAVHSLDNLTAVESEVEQNQLELPLADLRGKAVRIYREPDKAVYIAFVDPKNSTTNLIFDANNKQLFGESKTPEKKINENRGYDMLLRAYQLVLEKKYDEARKLATTLSSLKPKIAAPHIIEGMSWYYEGDRTKALASYRQALALDPANADLSQTISKLANEN